MAGKIEFRSKLGEILKTAEEQNSRITVEEVEKFFEEDALTPEQVCLVCDYLMSQKISVSGYEKRQGKLMEEKEEPQSLSQEEESYLTKYLRDIEQMKPDAGTGEQLVYYLPKVVEEARKLHSKEIFIGDMIQEGNISLMLALESHTDINEEIVMNEMRAGIKALIESQSEMKRQDKKMVERVSELDKTINEMKEDMGREVSIDEVALRLGITEEQVEDILKLAGDREE